MDMKHLLEKMSKIEFAGQAVGQKPGDQVRGTEKATTKKSGEHPFKGRLVGASESKSLLQDLEKQIVEGAHERKLKEEFKNFDESDGGVYNPPPGEATATDSHSPSPIGSVFDAGEENPKDTVTLDIPLVIRLLEFAREDAKDDMVLHTVAENLVKLSDEGCLTMDNYEQIVPQQEVNEDSELGYKKLHPIAFRARQMYPAAKSDMEALIMWIADKEGNDVNRLDAENDREDAEITQLDKEEDGIQRKLKLLAAQIEKLQAALQSQTVKEADSVPTAGGPAGSTTQPTGPIQPTKPGQSQDPAAQAALKQQQSKLQQNIASLKTAGVQVDPAKAAQTLQKTDTGAPMNATDKDTIATMAPALGNVLSNPSTASQLNTLIKKAGGGV